MRGTEDQQADMFSHVRPDDRAPQEHPLRRLRALVNGIQANMNKLFDARNDSGLGRVSRNPPAVGLGGTVAPPAVFSRPEHRMN
jgi:hypothetical protein